LDILRDRSIDKTVVVTPAKDETSVLNEKGILDTEVLCMIWDSKVCLLVILFFGR